MKVIVSFSGGKDSLAALLWTREHITKNFTTVFCDTGWEHPLTYEYIHRITDKLHLDLVTLKSKKYDGMVDLARQKKRWPSARAKMQAQCTFFKHYFEPYGYDKNGRPKRHSYRGKEVRAFRAQFADDLLRPVFDWSAQQVIDYILTAGLEPNPLYRMGYKRVGCWPCVMANQRDILNISRQSPERIDYIAQLEQELQNKGRRSSSFFGPDKIPAHAIASSNKYPDIRDVVRYVEWQNATGSLFDDDTATSCMSYYGLCE